MHFLELFQWNNGMDTEEVFNAFDATLQDLQI